MCGILGGINTSFNERSVARLHRRGPDQSRLVTETVPGFGGVTLGQTRLNVVDCEDTSLPVRIADAPILFQCEN